MKAVSKTMDVFNSTFTSILPDDRTSTRHDIEVLTEQDDLQHGTEDYSETYVDKLGDDEWKESGMSSLKVSKYNLF